MKMRLLFSAISLLFMLQLCSQDKIVAIDKMMQYAAENGLYSGVLVVKEKGNVIYNKGFGYADIEQKKTPNENTLFNLCSISKQFTAMCVMMLKEQGKISYEDKLVKYFPGLPYQQITLRQLLNHTSGLPDYFSLLFRGAWKNEGIPSNQDIVQLLEREKYAPRFSPGSKYEYCNTGYMLLSSLIEKVSGLSYGDFLHKNIFQPLGMTRTLVYLPHVSSFTPDNLALPYAYDYGKSCMVLTANYEPYKIQVTRFDGMTGDGGIYSCSHDMILWDDALTTEKLVKKTTLEEAFTNGVLSAGEPISPVGYGFGWFIVNDAVNGKIVQHTGGWPGSRQAIIRYLDKDRMILVLRNNEVTFSSIQKAIENILDGKPYTMPQTSIAYALSREALTGSIPGIQKKFIELKDKSIINEDDINLAGYGLLEQGKLPEALEIMKINASLFPGSWNVFDSLGELYLKNGDKENAKINYKKSLELNPGNEGAKKIWKDYNHSMFTK